MKTFWILLFWNLKILIFQIFRFFQKNIFFGTRKKKSGVEIFFWDNYSFDVKFSDLSIYDVFRVFGARQIWFPVPTSYCESKKNCSISNFGSCGQSETGVPLSGAKNISPKLQKLRQTLTMRYFRILIRLSWIQKFWLI